MFIVIYEQLARASLWLPYALLYTSNLLDSHCGSLRIAIYEQLARFSLWLPTCSSLIVAPLRKCTSLNFLPTTMPRRQPFEVLRWRNTSQDILCDNRQEDNTGRHIQPCNKTILMRNPDDGRKFGAVQYCSFKYHIDTVNTEHNSGYLRKGFETRDSTSPWQPVLHCQRKQMKSRSTLLSAAARHAASRASSVNEILFPAGKSLFLRSKRKHVKQALYRNSVTVCTGYLVPLCFVYCRYTTSPLLQS